MGKLLLGLFESLRALFLPLKGSLDFLAAEALNWAFEGLGGAVYYIVLDYILLDW